MSIRDIIEAAVPCSVCADDLRSTCESLGQCKTRDAWRRAEREVALMEAVCEAAEEWVRECQGAEYQDDGCTADSWGECERPCAARVHLTNLQAFRKERGL